MNMRIRIFAEWKNNPTPSNPLLPSQSDTWREMEQEGGEHISGLSANGITFVANDNLDV